MKSVTYTMRLSGGSLSKIKARSASDAIQTALEENIGQTVTECRSGLNEEEARFLRSVGQHAMAGEIFYDIPAHEPLTKKTARKKKPDETIKFPFYDQVKSK